MFPMVGSGINVTLSQIDIFLHIVYKYHKYLLLYIEYKISKYIKV